MVRIMTIHKSKGLEFPVVFVSDMGKNFNISDLKKDVLLDHKIGIGVDYIDLEQRAKYTTWAKEAVKLKIKQNNLSEEMRVLYVALTRAKEKLILTGSIKEKSIEKWCNCESTQKGVLSYYKMAQARNYLDWIMPAILQHKAGKEFLKKYKFDYYNSIVLQDTSEWSITLLNEQQENEEEVTQQQKQKQMIDYFNKWDNEKDYSGKRNQIFDTLDWKYTQKTSTTLQTNITISEIKRKWQEESNLSEEEKQWNITMKMPKFEKEGKKLTAAEIGTATHTFMEQCDIKKQYTKEDIIKEIAFLVEQNILSEQEAKALNVYEILMFFQSELAQRIRNADNIEQEKRFSMLMKANEIFTEKEYEFVEDSVMINGIIDCFFEENGQIVLIDYKNNRLWGQKTADTLKKQYEIQMKLYKKALEKSTGKEVKEVYLYSFALGKALLME